MYNFIIITYVLLRTKIKIITSGDFLLGITANWITTNWRDCYMSDVYWMENYVLRLERDKQLLNTFNTFTGKESCKHLKTEVNMIFSEKATVVSAVVYHIRKGTIPKDTHRAMLETATCYYNSKLRYGTLKG